VIEGEKCRVKTYQDAVKSLKELQESDAQWNDSDMLSVCGKSGSQESKLHANTLLEVW
jgi:hypothetical protein